MAVFIFFFSHMYLATFCQSFFLHRYASHRMYVFPIFWERFFYLLTYLSMGFLDMSPKAYALMHRMHHAYADTVKDPHSPIIYKNPFRLFGNTVKVFLSLKKSGFAESRFLGDLPEWPFFERWFGNSVARVVLCLGYTLFYVRFATAPWMFALLPIHFLMGPLGGTITNWVTHRSGTAGNVLKIDLIGLGEFIHSNHHAFPRRPNFAIKKSEWDPAYSVSALFSCLRILRFNDVEKMR